MTASAAVKALEERICHSPAEVRDVLRDECIEVSKHFCHLVRQSSAYAIFLCFTCRHLWVTAQQDRVPRLLLNEPEIGSHYLGYRNLIFNSGCFSDPSHCPHSAHHPVLNRSSLMLPCTATQVVWISSMQSAERLLSRYIRVPMTK